ncbi:MAG: hypothetical protein ACJAS1_001601 [Oleiphilaceae bacterium]|jgi:hypothetical protein
MSNQAYSYSSLSRHLYPDDFYKDQKLGVDGAYRAAIIQESIGLAKTAAVCGNVKTHPIKNKVCFINDSMSEKLVLRRCAEILRKSVGRLKSRHQIIDELVPFLKEGSQYEIYRLDIKSFFEKCSIDDLIKKINENKLVLSQTKNIVSSVVRNIDSGIPRGVEISSILSEIYLEDFDDKVRMNSSVLYYSRYVDDIIIVSVTNEDQSAFFSEIESYLPDGLEFNSDSKKDIIKVPVRSGGRQLQGSWEDKLIAKFDFLGYSLSVIDFVKGKPKEGSREYRKVEIDISDKKLKKLKTLIARSIYNYSKNNDFDLLSDRLEFLSTNRNMQMKRSKSYVLTGIFYNYARVNKFDADSSLVKLDGYLKGVLLSKNGRLSKSLNGIGKIRKNNLLTVSFVNGFKYKIFKKYGLDRLGDITRIWL